jgi:hypothetical protein
VAEKNNNKREEQRNGKRKHSNEKEPAGVRTTLERYPLRRVAESLG